ncbi:MAG: thermonuclease family protein [Candidatus Dadabacteria bacterium]|nr:MAG: thermonuclease family protein [Candidatus Dadabacteria bacterium]
MGCAGDRAAILEGPVTVIDGDTIEIGERRVRLFGIDAPEVAQMCRRRGGTRWPCGQYATVALDRLAGGKRATCTVRNTDSYGRAIAVCTSEGRDLGREQVRAGWAIAYRRYSRRYEQDEAAARRAGKGIWQGDFEPPWRWRERHPRR